jgi:AraC family transcriptional activator of tynA and feaB
VVRTESSPIVRLSTRDIAPADRLSYANWILSVTDEAAPTEVSAGAPCEFELEATVLELPAVTIVAMSGSPQRSVCRFGTRRTVERTFGLNLVFSGSWHVTHGTRNHLGPGDLHFTDSRHPFEYDFLTSVTRRTFHDRSSALGRAPDNRGDSDGAPRWSSTGTCSRR